MTVLICNDITSGTNILTDAYWEDNNRAPFVTDVVGPSGKRLDGSQFDSVDSYIPIHGQTMYNSAVNEHRPITCGAWVKRAPGSGWTIFYVQWYDPDSTILLQDTVTTGLDDWQLLMGTKVFSTSVVNSYFIMRVAVGPAGNSGDTFYIAHPFCFVNCESVLINPDLQSMGNAKKVEYKHRSTVGETEVYKWADIPGYKITASHVPALDANFLNGWWHDNQELKVIVNSGSEDVFDSKIVSRTPPMGKYQSVYTDEFKGTIDLGGY